MSEEDVRGLLLETSLRHPSLIFDVTDNKDMGHLIIHTQIQEPWTVVHATGADMCRQNQRERVVARIQTAAYLNCQ